MKEYKTHVDQAFWPIPAGTRESKIQPTIELMEKHWSYIKLYIHKSKRVKSFTGKRIIHRFLIIASLYELNTTDLFNFGIEIGQSLATSTPSFITKTSRQW